jgi:hypothetical protein
MASDTTLTPEEKLSLATKLKLAADQLTAQIASASTQEEADALDDHATKLRNLAISMVAQSIILRQNEVSLDAGKLGNAINHSSQVLERIAAVKKKIEVAAALLAFLPVLMAGNVPAIVKAGIALDKKLDEIEKG